ncbi:hypothetical protein HMPREF9420_1704 [Segatella salivae DSM 15606]|uniref:Uncharacterized protein n=1 Tax=Segatella salivae DSM 15606 TaxID=888832 RepID=E6MQD6_9BACT|nr:hypothetical protein HMPREF9420_1704 [Segatella salivae DSM 15606]
MRNLLHKINFMKPFMRYNLLRLKSLMNVFSLLFLFILYFKF